MRMATFSALTALIAFSGCTEAQHQKLADDAKNAKQGAQTVQTAVESPAAKVITTAIPVLEPWRQAIDIGAGVAIALAGCFAAWQTRKASEAKVQNEKTQKVAQALSVTLDDAKVGKYKDGDTLKTLVAYGADTSLAKDIRESA